jgi:hypothetical protein
MQGRCGLSPPATERETKPDLMVFGHGLQKQIKGHVDKRHVHTEVKNQIHPEGSTSIIFRYSFAQPLYTIWFHSPVPLFELPSDHLVE